MINTSLKVTSLSLTLALVVLLVAPQGFAQTPGVNAVGDTLPIGAGGHPVLTITGSTNTSQFSGAVTFGNTTLACTSSNAGAIRYYIPSPNPTNQVGIFEGCNGTVWGPLGGGSSFSVVTSVRPVANTRYTNSTGGALFISSVCPNSPNSSGYRESVDYYVYDANGNKVQASHGQVAEGGSDANFNAAPYASVMVPAGYSWSTMAVFGTIIGTCQSSVTASTAYSL